MHSIQGHENDPRTASELALLEQHLADKQHLSIKADKAYQQALTDSIEQSNKLSPPESIADVNSENGDSSCPMLE